jgi:hypothetical protein
MQTLSIALRPTAAATHTWSNGVVHHEEETDVYELPATAPGVAARVELTPRFFGLCADVVATDNQGQPLESHREWHGFHRVVVTRDPRSGLETVFDPREQTVSVATPRVNESIEAKHGGGRHFFAQEASQQLDSEGDTRFRSRLVGESEHYPVTQTPLAAGQYVPVESEEFRTWEETVLKKGEAPVAHRMTSDRQGERQGAALSASVQDGKLQVTDEEGVTRTYEMFLRA